MGSRSLLSGRLRFASLADLFQILGSSSSTGALYLRSELVQAEGRILFSQGNPVDAVAGPLRGLEAVYALFGWCDGSFEFFGERVTGRRMIQNGRMEIVLDALRMLDDGLIPRIGGPAPIAQEQPTSDLPLIRGPLLDYGSIVHEERMPAGRNIVTEGSHGNWIWVILDGKVLISRESRRGPVPVAHLGPGAFIGTFVALLFGECVRTATVTAVTDVHLALLDTYRLSAEFGILSGEFKRLLLLLSERLRESTDAFLEGRGGRVTPFSFPLPVDLQEGFPMDALMKEYGSLSRTFKNLIHYLGTGIRETGRMPGPGSSA